MSADRRRPGAPGALADGAARARRSPAAPTPFVGRLASLLILGYQRALSPLKRVAFGPAAGCRFYPTCSAYALACFQTLPAHRAGWLALRRILRCHPWGGSGYDPPPGARAAFPDDPDASELEASSRKPRSLKDML